MNPHKTILLAVVLLAITAPLARAQGTYMQFDPPGSVYTYGQGINTAGDIVGYYFDASNNGHGFLLSGGTYTTIDYPGATYTYIFGVNDVGQIVGYSASANGFLYDVQAQTFTTISYPHANSTQPLCINNAGKIAGLFFYGNNELLGFQFVGSRYKQITPPGARNSFVTGVSASGELVGGVSNGTGTSNFVFGFGKYEHLTIPNAPGALVNGVNPAGNALVGYYKPDSNTTAGFLYQSKILTTLQFPGSIYTIASGINGGGGSSGEFY